MSAARTVNVPVAGREYPVCVGNGILDLLPTLLPTTARRALIVTQHGIPVTVDLPIDTHVVTIGDGEAHKSLATIESIADQAAQCGLTRNDVVIGVGGGMVTDVAGFFAATWHRGVAVVHVATTLLAMVDAAVGGKTGVNIAHGKNLVGAYWQPNGVLCDLDTLASLPDREQRCGRGEMAKYHFLTGDDLLALDDVSRVARCVQIKADVVAADEREAVNNRRGRAILNYGHTLAHALETATDHRLAHGEAVAVGLIFAAHVAHVHERISSERVVEHYRVVADAYGLDTTLPADVDHDQLIWLMRRDKKVVDGDLTFVLDGPNGVEVVAGIPERMLRNALAEMTSQVYNR